MKKLPRPGLSLLAKFGVVSVIPVILSSLVLGRSLDGIVQKRTLALVREQAELVTALRIAPHLSSKEVRDTLSGKELAEFTRSLREAPMSQYVAAFKVWNTDRQPVYQNAQALAGPALPSPDLLESALSGQVVSNNFDLDKPKGEQAGEQPLLEVYVPLRLGSNQEPAGAVQLYLPYGPIEKIIAQDNHRLYLILLCGFTLFYAVLFRIVARASNRLRRQAEDNEYLALHDSLTGLPNRALFHERAGQAIVTAKREGWSLAVMIMDLDRFKEINDTLGHHHGDLVLQEMGNRLQPLLRETDTVARLGGDEFAVLLPHVENIEAALNVAEKIKKALEKPFYLQGLKLDVDASVGIAMFPHHGRDIHGLLRRADVAMYEAKATGRGHQVYLEEIDHHNPDKLGLGGELRQAISRNELVLHYQPLVGLEEDRLRNVEALVRWNHPSRGLLPPGEFIGVAEAGGLIGPLTMEVLNLALKQVNQWDSEGLHLNVAVNLSVRNLLDLRFPREVAKLLQKWSVDPIRLELEITESSIMADPVRAMEVLGALSRLGVRLAVDDFGTGYSSLASLKRLPINAVKIDKSFIQSMKSDENDLLIVQSIIDLAHNLGLEVVAEGVETDDTEKMLKLLGCDFVQGWHRGRPVPAKEIPWLLGVLKARDTGTEAATVPVATPVGPLPPPPGPAAATHTPPPTPPEPAATQPAALAAPPPPLAAPQPPPPPPPSV
jgi:diguanylate cyclase (GGDEF)-like protein